MLWLCLFSKLGPWPLALSLSRTEQEREGVLGPNKAIDEQLLGPRASGGVLVATNQSCQCVVYCRVPVPDRRFPEINEYASCTSEDEEKREVKGQKGDANNVRQFP